MIKRRILTEDELDKIEKSKKELKQYREDIKYIEEKLNDTEELRTKMEKVTTILSLTKTNSSNDSPDKFADAISKLEELKIDCSDRIKDLLIKKFKIDDKIDMIEQPYKNILFYRYSRGKNWNDVANELGYTRDYACELHGEALYLYSKI